MKKFLLISLLTLTFVLALGGCAKTENKTLRDKPTTINSEFTMTMVVKGSFYYPTLKGKVISPVYPSKIEASFDGESFSFNEYKSVIKVGNGYLVSFDTVYIFGSLYEGDYTVKLKAYDGDKSYTLDCETVFIVDDFYTACFGVDFETGEHIEAMDKESNWLGPYQENELPVMPITDGGNFVMSDLYDDTWF